MTWPLMPPDGHYAELLEFSTFIVDGHENYAVVHFDADNVALLYWAPDCERRFDFVDAPADDDALARLMVSWLDEGRGSVPAALYLEEVGADSDLDPQECARLRKIITDYEDLKLEQSVSETVKSRMREILSGKLLYLLAAAAVRNPSSQSGRALFRFLEGVAGSGNAGDLLIGQWW